MSDPIDLVFNRKDQSKAAQDKNPALRFYPSKSQKDPRGLNKEQGKGKTVCNKAALTTSAGEMGFFHTV